MVSKVEFETIDTRSLELESIISHMTIIFEVRTIYRLHMYGSYVLKNDIDLSDYENWTPIGTTPDSAFHGKFDGQGYSITGLHSEESFDSGTLTGVSYTSGLFGVCDGAEIKNVRIGEGEVSIETTSGYRYDDAAITSDYNVYAGMLIGYACNDTVIYNCNTSGNVSANASGEGYSDSIAGGLVGTINSGIISYSYSNCVVDAYNGNATSAYDAYSGGLVGTVDNDIIIDKSYNEGNIIAQTLNWETRMPAVYLEQLIPVFMRLQIVLIPVR